MRNQYSFAVLAASALFFWLHYGASAQTTATWSGGGTDNYWSSAANWGGTAPSEGLSLAFGGTTRLTNVNDIAADTGFTGITFNNTSGAFSLSGNRIVLNGSLVNNDSELQTLGMDLVFSASRTVNAASGAISLNGVLSGSGGIAKTGSQVAVLRGNNTYEGATEINGGILRIYHAHALGTAATGTTVANNCRLELAGDIAVTGEPVTIVGRGGNNNGALQVYSGSNTWNSSVLIGSSDARIGVSAGNGVLVVSGGIDDGANTYPLVVRCADNGGPVVLSGTNTYKGETQLVVGTLKLSGADDRLPTNTVIRVGNSSNVAYATVDLNGNNQTVKGLLADGTTMPRKVVNSSLDFVSLRVDGSTDYTYAGSLDGRLNLEKRGSSCLTLSSTCTHTGLTSVVNGALLLGSPYALMESTVNTGDGPMGTLAFGANTVVNFGGLVGTNDLVMTNASGSAVSLRIRGNQTTTYDGSIINGCDFTKAGNGTLSLNNANTYTGRTYIAGGSLMIASEDSLGVSPASFVADRIVFDGGSLKANAGAFTLSSSNRGITLASGGGTLDSASRINVFTLSKRLVGTGALSTRGVGVVCLTESNEYDGVTTVIEGALRITDSHGLGSSAAGTVVSSGSELELGNGVTVSNETITLIGNGIVSEPPPPSVPNTNRGALQTASGCTAEWAGPIILGANQARIGAQVNGHLIVSGVIDDGAATYALRTSSNPGDRVHGVEFRAHNTYGGSTDLTRGTLVLGIADAIPSSSVLDVHWAASNNGEYTGLDLNGFDQTVGGLKNSGDTGANAMITNRSTSVSTLTVSQDSDTVYGGTIHGPIALVKDGAGRLTLSYPTCYSGDTIVRGGTLTLGINDAVSSTSALKLEGGTLELGSTTNAFSSLTVSADSSMDLGQGQILFVSQTSAAWSGQLDLTGTLEAQSVRTQPLLTQDQLSRIRCNGKHVSQNANGYLSPYYGVLIRVR